MRAGANVDKRTPGSCVIFGVTEIVAGSTPLDIAITKGNHPHNLRSRTYVDIAELIRNPPDPHRVVPGPEAPVENAGSSWEQVALPPGVSITSGVSAVAVRTPSGSSSSSSDDEDDSSSATTGSNGGGMESPTYRNYQYYKRYKKYKRKRKYKLSHRRW